MKKKVEDKLRFNNNLTFWSLWGLIVVLVICQTIQSIDLRREIDSMPHYECWNESFEEFVDKSDTLVMYTYSQGCSIIFRNNKAYHVCDEPEKHQAGNYYNGFEAECDNESNICYVSGVKELCKLNKDVFRDLHD